MKPYNIATSREYKKQMEEEIVSLFKEKGITSYEIPIELPLTIVRGVLDVDKIYLSTDNKVMVESHSEVNNYTHSFAIALDYLSAHSVYDYIKKIK